MKIAVIDTETGGLNPKVNSLLSLAIGIFEKEDLITFKDWNIKPENGNYVVSPYALDVNKINLVQHYSTALPISDVRIDYNSLMAERKDIIYMGHNFNFDAGFLSENGFVQYSVIMRNYIDTKALALHFMTIGKLPVMSSGLQNLIKYFNIDPGVAHTATDDVLSTYKLYLALSRL